MFDEAYFSQYGLAEIFQKVSAGMRLDRDDGLKLFGCTDLTALGALASHVRFSLHGPITTYVVNRQVNYTNICVNDCLFCAFRRDDPAQPGAFTLSKAEILARIAEAVSFSGGLDELHMVGGCHPDLPFEWYEDLVATVSRQYPRLPIKAFTPVEIAHFAAISNLSVQEVLLRLKRSGLRMMPGGGAEIFDPDLRKKICPAKANAAEWLRISGEAHKLGLTTNCTMLFGHLETLEQRVDHLMDLRRQQDETGGFTCFIPLPYLKKNNNLRLPDSRADNEAFDRLRTIAISRLLLDNIPHIKAYWIMLGTKLAQTALWYGADDLDGTIVEEKIGHMAGAGSTQGLSMAQLEKMISDSGFVPARRNAMFEKSREAA